MTSFNEEKSVLYRGKQYMVPEWGNYIATQPTGEVYGFKEKPGFTLPGNTISSMNVYNYGWDLNIQFIRISVCRDWLNSLECV